MKPKKTKLVVHRGPKATQGTKQPVLEAASPLRPPGPTACAECGGAVFLCQGRHEPEEGQPSAMVLQVVSALRAAYMGVLLTPVAPAEQLGGTLILAAQAALLDADPRSVSLAAFIADPRATMDPVSAAQLACAMTQKLDESSAKALRTGLRDAQAPYLRDATDLVFRAALACPVTDHRSFDLIALLCASCAAPDAGFDRFAFADNYDAAVSCPSCHAEHDHPFGTKFMRRIHPISRCYVRDGENGKACCLAHEGSEVTLGLCAKGRSIYEGTFAHVGVNRIGAGDDCEPWERRLVEALLRAKQRENLEVHDAQMRQTESVMDRLGRMFHGMLEGSLLEGTSSPPKLKRRTRSKR